MESEKRENPLDFLSYCLEFWITVFQHIVVNSAFAADKFGAHSGGEQDRLADVILTKADGNSHHFQVHTDQRAANVQPGVCPDLLHRHRMGEGMIGGGGKGTACLGLRDDVDDLRYV